MSDAQGKGPGAQAIPLTRGADPLVGRVINDRFRVIALIARGGMGRVYRAEQQPLGRQIALKVLSHGDDASDPDFQQRFFLEAATCAKLRHANTVTVFDFGRTDDDVYYIAMELLEGRTLRQAMSQDGPFSASRAVHVALQIGRSLREAHGLGITHRDLKPGNVFLIHQDEEEDFVKVLDFGLVKTQDVDVELTRTGQFMGSPKYIAPEQIRGRGVDGRADVYSLGVLLFEMLTGRPPFARETTVDTLMAHIQDPVPPLNEANPDVAVPVALEAVVMRCLRKPREDRFPSMDALMNALKAAASMADMSLPPGGMSSPGLPILDVPGGPPPAPPEAYAVGDEAGEREAPVEEIGGMAESSISETPGFASMGQSGGTPWLGLGLAGAGAAAVVILGIFLWPGGTPAHGHLGNRHPGAKATTAVPKPGAAPSPGNAAAPPARGAPPPTGAPSEAAAPAGVTLHLASDPTGARVSTGRHVLCVRTPCETTWHPQAPGEILHLRFHRPGYHDRLLDQALTGDRITVDAHLAPVHHRHLHRSRTGHPHRAAPRHPPKPPKHRKKSSGLGGYKANPY